MHTQGADATMTLSHGIPSFNEETVLGLVAETIIKISKEKGSIGLAFLFANYGSVDARLETLRNA